MTSLHTFLSSFRITPQVPIVGATILPRIREQAQRLADTDDDQLRAESHALRDRVVTAKTSIHDDDIATAFSLVGESLYRSHQMRFYDVQFLAGLSLLRNEIAEMKTGEGKTLVGALASFAKALHGRGVHFMTTNAYLAQRDFETVLPIFQRLGMSVGLLQRESTPQEKHTAYQCDVTYGPGYEFGFDYLRDQLSMIRQRVPELGERFQTQYRGGNETSTPRMQREHFCAIVDEADSVLIDEATTPLILSGAPGGIAKFPDPYRLANDVASSLNAGEHYAVDGMNRRVSLTNSGQVEATRHLDTATLAQLRRPWHHYVEHALQARLLFSRDAEYVVTDDEVKLVDSNTGRIFDDRTWSGGLHQAVEAKEGVTITDENNSLARISRQQYFRIYDNLCGMTGTAADGAAELRSVYGLTVADIPTHKPCQRLVQPPRVFATEDAKWDAIAKSVRQVHATTRPVLIGTRTIENSEKIAARLGDLNVQILNGKQDADEARMIATAGQRNAIMIATNMAGRGTDIKLGDGVAALGGLHVIVSEPHDTARVDRQLMGRASRQGDPGSCQMFVSADDQLFMQYAPWMVRFIRKVTGPDQEAAADLSREITKLQKTVERKSAAMRREMFSQEAWHEQVLSALAKRSP